MTQQVADLAAHVIDVCEPLCENTEKLLSKVSLLSTDRLELKYDARENVLYCRAFGILPDGNSVRPSPNATRNWVTRIPEREALAQQGHYALAATDFTAIVIAALWPAKQLIFHDEDTRQAYNYWLARFAAQQSIARQKAAFKLEGTMPPVPEGWLDNFGTDRALKPYQTVMAVTSLEQEASLYLCEQGTGKTPPAIALLMNEAKRHRLKQLAAGVERLVPYHVVVVCPKKARFNWQREIIRFATTPGQVVVLRGLREVRVQQLVDSRRPLDSSVEWSVVISSYGTVEKTWDAFRMMEWDRCVLDESHHIKGWYAKRQAFFLRFRDHCRRRLLLTGTPVANNIVDFWGQLEFLGEGMSGFSDHKAFKSFYTRYYTDYSGGEPVQRFAGFKNLPVLQERLARVAIQFTKAEVLPHLPKKQYRVVEVTMAKEQAKYYKKLKEELAIEIEGDLRKAESGGDRRAVTVQNVLVKLLRLAQITSGFIRWDQEIDLDTGEKKGPIVIDPIEPNPKIEALGELLEELGPDEKMVVWACFKQDVQRISKLLEERNYSYTKLVGGMSEKAEAAAFASFNSEAGARVLIGSAASGGTGVNLPGHDRDRAAQEKTDATQVVYFSQNWKSLERSQSEDRTHGEGRCRRPVTYTDLVVPGSIDEEIRARVVECQIHAWEIQDIRDVMKRILAQNPGSNDD